MSYYVVIRDYGSVEVPCSHKHYRHTSAVHCARLQSRRHPVGVMSDRGGVLRGYRLGVRGDSKDAEG